MISPLSFTLEFRRKLAELPVADRRQWLDSLATSLETEAPSSARDALELQLREVARGCRLDLVASIEQQLGPFLPLHLRALLDVPRERFVRADDVRRSADDTPLPLDDEGLATISAPHAYLLSFRLLDLAPGDTLLELGTGSGYGAALAAFIVGDAGAVVTVEIDEALAAWAERSLADDRNVTVLRGDAEECGESARGARKVVATFAVSALPDAWLRALPEGGVLVAPVGPRERDQKLVRVERVSGDLCVTEHGAVRYVRNRSPKPR